MKKSMQNFLTTPIAHRGLHSDAVPENSLEGFRLAVDQGYGIEFDVHLTKDGHLVVMHDYNTLRACGQKHVIERSSFDLLRSLTLTNGQKIPTLDEVLDVVDGAVPLVIELKSTLKFNKKLADLVLKRLQSYQRKDLVALESFHPSCVKYLKEHTDQYPVGQLATALMKGVPKFVGKYLGQLKVVSWNNPDFVCYDILSLPSPHVSRLKEEGMPILTYTIDTPSKLALAKTCTDNVIFEKIIP